MARYNQGNSPGKKANQILYSVSELTLTPPASEKIQNIEDEYAELVEDTFIDLNEYENFVTQPVEEEKKADVALDGFPEFDENDLERDGTSLSGSTREQLSDEMPEELPLEPEAEQTPLPDIDFRKYPTASKPVDLRLPEENLKTLIDSAVAEEIEKLVARHQDLSDIQKKGSLVNRLASPEPVLLENADARAPGSDYQYDSQSMVGGKEVLIIMRDIATTAARLVLFLPVLVLDLIFLAVAVVRLIVSPNKTSAHRVTSSAAVVSSDVKVMLAPLFDHRFWIFLSYSLMSTGLFFHYQGQVKYALSLSVAFFIPGLGVLLAGAVFRVTKAMGVGRTSEFIPRNWSIDWLDDSGLDSKRVQKLNDDFGNVVGDLFTQLGFSSRLNDSESERLPGDILATKSGVDILVTDSEQRVTVVSCRRRSAPVGIAEVQEIFAISKSFSPARAAVVTTVGFTEAATLFAAKNNMLLMIFPDLLKTAMKYRT